MMQAKNTKQTVEYAGKAALYGVRISARKARLVMALIRGRQVGPALEILDVTPKKAAALTAKVLRSAVANAREKGADVDKLWVTRGWVDMGRPLKRYMPRAQGRATMIRKKSAHIHVILGEK